MSYDHALLSLTGLCVISFLAAIVFWLRRRRSLGPAARPSVEVALWLLGALSAVLTVLGFLAQTGSFGAATIQPAAAGGQSSDTSSSGLDTPADSGQKPWLAPVAAGLPQIVRFGVPAEEWPTVFDLAKAAGYMTVRFSAHDIGGSTYVNAIFRPADGTAWWTTPWMTAGELDAAVAEKAAAGLGLVDLTSTVLDGHVRYGAVWAEGVSGRIHHYALNSQEQQARFEQLADDGYRPITVSGVAPDGTTQWTALYEKDTGEESWSSYRGMTPAEFDDALADNADEGRYPVWLNAFQYRGAPYLSAVWRSAPATDDTHHGLTADELTALIAAAEAEGRLVQSIAGYELDDEPLFVATW